MSGETTYFILLFTPRMRRPLRPFQTDWAGWGDSNPNQVSVLLPAYKQTAWEWSWRPLDLGHRHKIISISMTDLGNPNCRNYLANHSRGQIGGQRLAQLALSTQPRGPGQCHRLKAYRITVRDCIMSESSLQLFHDAWSHRHLCCLLLTCILIRLRSWAPSSRSPELPSRWLSWAPRP